MRLLGQILLACLIIAVLQGMLAVLAVAVVLALICGLLLRPAETAALVVLLLFLRAVELWPGQTLAISTCAGVAFLIGSRARRPRGNLRSRPRGLLAPPETSNSPPNRG
jgi:hypothetical protein